MSDGSGNRRVLAAPAMGERGGGVGQVSLSLWQAMQDTWPDRTDLVMLLRNGHPRPQAADKLRFGVALAGRHVLANPEWILFSHLGLAQIERYVPAMFRTPYAIFLHGIEVWRPLGPVDHGVLRRATLRIANSTFTAREAERANPGLGKIEVCPLALPKSPVELPATPSAVTDSKTVLVVGRLAATERYKGHEQLLRAWPGVVARVPDARLVIVGEGDDAPRLMQMAARASLGESVRFTGFMARPELEAEYARAALFALPSRGEGFGLVYLEAMSHGLACVGSHRDAASEVIVDGETGALTDPEDIEAIGRTIIDLLESPERRLAWGRAGRARVDQHFRYERFRDQITGLLQRGFSAHEGGR